MMALDVSCLLSVLPPPVTLLVLGPFQRPRPCPCQALSLSLLPAIPGDCSLDWHPQRSPQTNPFIACFLPFGKKGGGFSHINICTLVLSLKSFAEASDILSC